MGKVLKKLLKTIKNNNMLKFDKPFTPKKENESNFLKKLKNSPSAGIAKTLTLGAGLMLSQDSFHQDVKNHSQFFTIDEKAANSVLSGKNRPEEYDLSAGSLDLEYLDEKKSLDDDNIKKVALDVISKRRLRNERPIYKIDSYGASLVKQQREQDIERLKSAGLDIPEKYKNEIKKCEKIINESREQKKMISKNRIWQNRNNNNTEAELSKDEKKFMKLITKMITVIEQARKEAERLISSQEYLKKLQEEFGSLDIAKQHQKVRLNNIRLSNYKFESKEKIADFYMKDNEGENHFSEKLGKNGFCYDTKHDNIIYFLYEMDIDGGFNEINNNNQRLLVTERQLRNIALHEFIHKATKRNSGLSPEAIRLLGEESFKKDKNIDDYQNEYLGIPTERYTRLKVLEDDLEKHGIKKVGEKFTRDHYIKMMKLYRDGDLDSQSSDFIHSTELSNSDTDDDLKIFERLFNEIAAIDKTEKQNNFYPPEWYEDNNSKNLS